jgi:ElaB/YqjD/DUF883 family membrane-anchored ribosome-binding protein
MATIKAKTPLTRYERMQIEELENEQRRILDKIEELQREATPEANEQVKTLTQSYGRNSVKLTSIRVGQMIDTRA